MVIFGKILKIAVVCDKIIYKEILLLICATNLMRLKEKIMLKIRPLSSLVKVFSDEEPKADSFCKLSSLRNEKVQLQVAVCSDKDCEVNVEIVSPLKHCIKTYWVQEIFSKTPVHAMQDNYTLRDKSGYFPELLRPLEGSLKLGANKWTSIWLELIPNPEFEAKEHNIQVKVGEESVDFTINVINANLPEQSLIYTSWFHSDCIATHYNLEVFSDKYWDYVQNFLQVACDYGMNMVLTPLFTPPLDTKVGGERLTVQLVGVKVENGKYTFDFSALDKWIEMCDKVGIKYFELSHFFTQWGAKKCPKIMAEVDGVQKRIFGWDVKASSKAYREFLTAFAAAFKPYMKQKGIEDRVFFHVSDEPFAAVARHYRKASNLVQELFGDYKIMDALSNYKFYKKGLVKLPVPANDHIKPFIGNVPELWTYYCCVQVKGVSNKFFSMPSQRNRVLGYQMYKYDVKGFLHWGYNFWYKQFSVGAVDPFTETDAGGSFPSGDSFVVYPGEDGKPLQSLRLKVFYDGFQDMRALQLLDSLTSKQKVMQILEEGIDPITFDSYPHSDEWQLETREKINLAIDEALTK